MEGAYLRVVLERAGAGGDLADDIALLVVRYTGVPAAPKEPADAGSTSVVGAGD